MGYSQNGLEDIKKTKSKRFNPKRLIKRIPKDRLEQYIVMIKNLMIMEQNIIDSIIFKMKKDPELADTMLDYPNLYNLLELLAKYGEKMDYIENNFSGNKRRINGFTVCHELLYDKDVHYQLNQVADIIHYYKWKNDIDKDPELAEILSRLNRCPRCNRRIADWFNKNCIRMDEDLPIKFDD